ncbi:MAG: FAD-dependent oxidoreductase [Natronomonas sp.]
MTLEEHETDVLVVGSGIAGCAAALKAADAGADVTLATKATAPEESTSWWAQGGIAIARGDPEAFAEDIHAASDGLADRKAVETLVESADAVVREVLIDTLGVSFDTSARSDGAPDGVEAGYDYGREAAHSESRILHVDATTGRHILTPFMRHLQEEPSVTVLEDTAALELLTHEGRIHGAMIERGGDIAPCFAGETILATGGVGACYHRSTNPETATGDGVAMAALAGADIEEMEYVQFHPTAFADESGRGTFLLSEAVRGEGGLLRNADGERFMPDRHPDAELAPRDVVARAVRDERNRTGAVFLDVSAVDFRAEFPELAAACSDRGVDPADGIPVAPAEHFLCGGIDVDTDGRTSLDGLYAVGECARTGVHGANRLASTSLLEGLVWGSRAGVAAAEERSGAGRVEVPRLQDTDPELPDRFAVTKFDRLRRVMSDHVGIERTHADLTAAAGTLRRLKGEIDAYTRTRTSRELYELRNACIVSLLITRAAADNDESRGCHHVREVSDAA